MTINLTASAPSAEELEEGRNHVRASGFSAARLLTEFEDIYTAIGQAGNPSLHVERAHDDDGNTYTDVRFIATSRYTVDGVRYVLGEGIRFNYDSVIDNLKAITNSL